MAFKRSQTPEAGIDGGGYDGLLMNDAVTPAQWRGLNRLRPNDTGEHRLLRAMLIDALRVYKRGKPKEYSGDGAKHRHDNAMKIYNEAVEWLTDLEFKGVNGLREICGALSHEDFCIAPEAIAAHVKAGRPIEFVYRPYTSGRALNKALTPRRRGSESRVGYRPADFPTAES